MKNRKLFAILTLIAFMMTLLPVAAFAAPDANKDADRHASILRTDKTKVEADGQKDVEFTVFVRDKNNKAISNAVVYVASERSSDTIVSDDVNKYVPVGPYEYSGKAGTADVYAFITDANGKAVFNVSSRTSGDAKIAVGLECEANDTKHTPGYNPYTYLVDSDVTAENAKIIGAKTITFEATKADLIVLTEVKTRSENEQPVAPEAQPYAVKIGSVEYPVDEDYRVITKDTLTNDDLEAAKDYKGAYKAYQIKGDTPLWKSVKKVKTIEYDVWAKNVNISKQKANGSDYYELTFQVKNKSGAPVEGEKVDFSVNKSKSRLNKDKEETDAAGEVKVRVYADKHGDYEVQAKKGTESVKVVVSFVPSTIDDFDVVKDLDSKIAYDEEEAANFKLQLKDSNGNNYDLDNKADAIELVANENIIFEWVNLPSDSDREDEDFRDEAQDFCTKNSEGQWVANSDVSQAKFIYEDNGLLKIKLPELDEEGKYALKVSLDTGKTHTFHFEAKEQGEVVKLTLEYDEEVLALGATSNGPTVKRIDADGVKLDADDNLEWSVSDYKLLAKDYDIDENDGIVKATDDDDYTGELVVTVIDTKEDLTASTTITIADAAVGMELVPQEEVFAVGEEGLVDLIIKDRKGNQVALGNVQSSVDFDYYVVSQPEGALVSAEEGAQFSKGVKEKGKAAVKVYSNKEGEAKITMVITYTEKSQTEKNADGTYKDITRKLSKTVTVNFGEKKEVKTIGAKNVTLFINGTGYVVDGAAKVTDVAPFIQDNRTFVPVRIVAEALGCENEDTMWDPATQTVTLEREDLTITMTIGSNILTVSTGETVVSDVAPFIKDGRTVLPFRAIAEAFGADVEAIFAADGSVTGVTFEQE